MNSRKNFSYLKSFLMVVAVVLASVAFFLYLDSASRVGNRVNAYETSCPPEMSDVECFAFLQEQANQIKQQKSSLNSKITDEEYQQLSIIEKISYYNEEVLRTQSNVDEITVKIEQNNAEIRILEKDIKILEDNISIASQEISKLQNAIKKRIILSYKYASYTPLEIMLNSEEFDSLMSRVTYLKETRNKDRELLEGMSAQIANLEIEKDLLDEKNLKVKEKQKENEAKQEELVEERKTLASHKQQQEVLLANSEAKKAQYLNSLQETNEAQHAIDDQIAQLIEKLYSSGNLPDGSPVNAGQVIGNMGNTGLSYAPHLHFLIFKRPGGNTAYGNINPWNGYLKRGPDIGYVDGDGCIYYNVRSGSFQLPLAGDVVLVPYFGCESEFHQGYAIDLYSFLGEGAPVLAAHSGTLYKDVDGYGGKYAFIEREDGLTTLYLHLK